MAMDDEQSQTPSLVEVDLSSNDCVEPKMNEIVVVVPITESCESLDVCIADIIWERLSNFHDISWLFDTNTVLEKTEGYELSVGATRTYIKDPSKGMNGGTETVLERDETRRFLKWTLDSVKDYEASVEVFDTHIRFKNKGRLPRKVLEFAKQMLKAKLKRVISESEITSDDILNMESNVECLDKYTKLILKRIPEMALQSETILTDADKVPEPSLEKFNECKLETFQIGSKYCLKILPKDDYFGKVSTSDKIFLKGLGSTTLFPIKDKFMEIPLHLVEKFRAYYKFDKCFPPSNKFYEELESDESISEMAFSGVMSMWVKDDTESENNKDGFMCDYSKMVDLQPRSGWRKLGAKAYFDSNQKLVRIHDCHKNRDFTPDHPGWDHAKMLLKVSAGQWNTGCDHLLGVHMIATNSVINAAVQNLSLEHTIRRLIQPFSFRSVYVNNRSMDSLLSDGSLVLHACGYAKEELMKLLEIGFERCEMWATPEERLLNAGPNVKKISDEGKFPYVCHSIRLHKCFEEFVEKFIGHTYDSDEMVKDDQELQNFAQYLHDQLIGTKFAPPKSYETKADVIKVLSTFMFNATGMHEYVGTVSEYINHPKKLGFRLREGATTIDFQSWLIGMLLFTVTTVPMPKLLSDFNQCYTKPYEQEEWSKCKDSLKNLSAEFEKENHDEQLYLEHPFTSFDPKVLECSVNV